MELIVQCLLPFPSLRTISPPWTTTLAAAVSTLAAHIHAATYRLLVLIAELDRREVWAAQGALSCAHWLSWACGIDTHPTHTSVALVHPSPMASIPKRSNHALRLEPASDGDTPAMANATPNGTDRTLAAIRRVRFGTTSVSLSGGIAQVQRDVLHTGGRVLHMNLLPDERPCWRVTRNVDRTVTLHPSIWRNKDCGSHFWLRNGRIRWC